MNQNIYCVQKPNGSCVKSKFEDSTSINCQYNTTSKRCNKVKKTRSKVVKPKSVNVSMNRNKTLKIEKNTEIVYYGYLVEKPVKTYLDKLVIKASALKMRKRAKDLDLYIPLHEYKNAKAMKEYVIDEILVLARNDARDNFKSNVITVNNVIRVIKDDYDLTSILL